LGTVTEWQWFAGPPGGGTQPIGTVASVGWSIGGLSNPRDAEWGPDGYVCIAEQGTAPNYLDGTALLVKRADNTTAWSQTNLGFASNVESVIHEVWVDDGWVNQGAIGIPNLIWGYNAFMNIKPAIAAVTGSTVHVLPGTYVESGQIVIDKDLTVIGDAFDKPVVETDQDTGMNGDARGWWLVEAGVTLDMQNLVLDGSGYKIWQGIRQKGQGSVDNVDFVNMKYYESGPYYAGTAMAAFGDGPVNVTNSTFTEIGWVGVQYWGSDVSGSVFAHNSYCGKGAGDWLDYALDICAGAQVTVSDCSVVDCLGVASPYGMASAGIRARAYYASGTKAQITDSTITDCAIGISVGLTSWDSSNVKATNNIIMGNTMGIRNVSTSVVVDAEFNYWGHWSGPYDPNGSTEVPPCDFCSVDDMANADGQGDPVSENVDYCPWKPRPDGYVAVATESVTDVGDTHATFHGTLLGDSGTPCQWRFYYWKSTDWVISVTPWTGWIRSGDTFSKVMTGLLPGTRYYYWADCINTLGQCGWDSGIETFTTLDESIELNAPNGGECLLGGSVFKIDWSANPGIADVRLECSLDLGTTWHRIATLPNVDPKQYDWTVPAMPTDAVLDFHCDNDAGVGEDYATKSIVWDYSGSENHGSLLDPPGIPTWIPDGGVSGGAFDFTGTGPGGGQSILVIPHDESLNPGPNDFSIALWVKTRENVDGDILRKGSAGNSSTWYKLEHGAGPKDKLSLNFNTNGTNATVVSTTDYNDGQWHFVVAQRNGDQAELWIDGVLDGTKAVSGEISNDANMAIGSMDTLDDDFLNDSLDEIRMYGRSLSSTEIQIMYLLGNSEQCLVSVSDANDPNMIDLSDDTFCITTHVAPDLVGMPQADAEAAITAAGLAVGAISSDHSYTVPAGSVISQQPPAGAPVCPSTAVGLVISLGPKPKPASAPPVVVTEAPTAIGSDTITLNGKITDDGDGSCEYRFVVWKSGDWSFTYTSWTGYAHQGDVFSHVLTGLPPDTRYYYWAEARNSAGTHKGWDSGIESVRTSP